MLGADELSELFDKIYDKLMKEITLANRTSKEELDRVLDKYGFAHETEEAYSYIDLRSSRVLIVGKCNIKQKDINGLCKSIGFDSDRIDYVDFDQATNFNYAKLSYSSVYSDVIFGSVPHSGKGKEDDSSIIAHLEKNPSEYPRIIRATDSNSLNINKTSLKKALMETRIYNEG